MRVGPGEEAADAVNAGDLIAGGLECAFAEATAARNTTVSFATIPSFVRAIRNSYAVSLQGTALTMQSTSGYGQGAIRNQASCDRSCISESVRCSCLRRRRRDGEFRSSPTPSRVAANDKMSVLVSKAGRWQGAEEGPPPARWEGKQW